MTTDEQNEIEDAVGKFEVLVDAMRSGVRTDRQFMTMLGVFGRAFNGDDQAVETLLDARDVIRKEQGRL